jgi:hypothetical protein
VQAQDEQSQSQEPEYEGLDFSRYKDWWREAVDGYSEPRSQHIRDEEYYDGDVKGDGWGHWTRASSPSSPAAISRPSTRNIICRQGERHLRG